MPNKALHCPLCNSSEWTVLEEIQSTTRCKIERAEDGITEIEMTPEGEFVRETGSAVTIAYLCAGCGHRILPEALPNIDDQFFK